MRRFTFYLLFSIFPGAFLIVVQFQNSENPGWKYGDITSRIIAAAMDVHRELGPGFPEYVYSRALEIEFPLHQLVALREVPIPVYYKDKRITTRRVDFFVENLIPLEIKAIENLDNDHLVQALNYLEAWRLEIGLLINFG